MEIIIKLKQAASDYIEKHPSVKWVGYLGSIASILTFIFILLPGSEITSVAPAPTINSVIQDNQKILEIIEVSESSRGPIWGYEHFDDDEIIVKVTGKLKLSQAIFPEHSIVFFWRLGNDFETNWHLGRRRVSGNYRVASLPIEKTV
jgi:hypothetical protein